MAPRKALLVSVALFFVACGSNPSAPDEPLPVVRLRDEAASFSYHSGLSQPQQFIVRDKAAWEQTWAAIWRPHSPQPSLPEIDFSREMIVVAAMGARNTSGYSVFIESASAGPGGINVRVRSVSPAAGCALLPVVTEPVDVARMPRRDGPGVFDERREVQDCR